MIMSQLLWSDRLVKPNTLKLEVEVAAPQGPTLNICPTDVGRQPIGEANNFSGGEEYSHIIRFFYSQSGEANLK